MKTQLICQKRNGSLYVYNGKATFRHLVAAVHGFASIDF